MPPSQPPARLLCLHGNGSNDSVTAAQIRNLGLDRYFEITYLKAPWQCNDNGEIDESVKSLCPNGPFHSWIRSDGNYGTDVMASLRFVLNHISAHGPYDAVYGFSHGAGIAALLSCDAIRAKLVRGDEKRNLERAKTPWKFIFAACASFPLPMKDIQAYFEIDDFGLTIPGAHMIGIQDPSKGKSEAFLDNFGDIGNASLAVYFEGGHEISGDTKNLKKVAIAVVDWFAKHCPELNHAASEYSFLREVTEEVNALALHQPKEASIGGKIGQYQLNRISKVSNDITLASLLQRQNIQDRIAFRSPGKQPIEYGELLQFVRNEGNLSTVGCKQGDKVAYLVPFGVVGAVAFISIAMQCQAIPLDPESTSVNLDDAMLQLNPDHFIIFNDLGEDVISRAETSAEKMGIRIIYASGAGNQTVPFVFLHQENHNSADDAFFVNKGDDNCLLLRTSGTTSQPKVCFFCIAMIANLAYFVRSDAHRLTLFFPRRFLSKDCPLENVKPCDQRPCNSEQSWSPKE